MTLHDKLKEILEQHDFLMSGPDVECTPSTISAIIQAVAERLPGEKEYPDCEHLTETYYRNGWNAYRQEVRKVLSPLEIDTGDGFKPVSADRGSFTDPDSST